MIGTNLSNKDNFFIENGVFWRNDVYTNMLIKVFLKLVSNKFFEKKTVVEKRRIV